MITRVRDGRIQANRTFFVILYLHSLLCSVSLYMFLLCSVFSFLLFLRMYVHIWHHSRGKTNVL